MSRLPLASTITRTPTGWTETANGDLVREAVETREGLEVYDAFAMAFSGEGAPSAPPLGGARGSTYVAWDTGASYVWNGSSWVAGGGGGGGLPAPWAVDATALAGPKYVITDVDGFGDSYLTTVNVADDAGGSATLLRSPYNDNNYGNVLAGLANASEAQIIAWVKALYDTYELYGNTLLGHFLNIGNPTNANGGICSINPVSNGEVWVSNVFPGGGLKLFAGSVADDGYGGSIELNAGTTAEGGTPGDVVLRLDGDLIVQTSSTYNAGYTGDVGPTDTAHYVKGICTGIN